MAGHSKWHNIKRKKEINDSKRAKVFTKVARLITVAAKKGGGDPDSNPALRLAIDKAKSARLPKENIKRAILKGTGKGPDSDLYEATYEGYGVGGVAFLVTTVTDNTNRTVAELKTLFNKHGGNLGAPGSTAYIFASSDRAPTFVVTLKDSEREKILSLKDALEDHDDIQDIFTNLSP